MDKLWHAAFALRFDFNALPASDSPGTVVSMQKGSNEAGKIARGKVAASGVWFRQTRSWFCIQASLACLSPCTFVESRRMD